MLSVAKPVEFLTTSTFNKGNVLKRKKNANTKDVFVLTLFVDTKI
jgi:hypothetical protein